MQSNYQPWEVKIEDFYKLTNEQERIKFLLNFAILAPSGHNSQPWEFTVSNKEINIFINKERSLEKSDPQGRVLLMGFGCLIENILIASDYFRFEATVNYFPDKDNNLNIARITFEKVVNINKLNQDHLIFQISKRHTNRGFYKKESLPQIFLSTIDSLSSEKVKVLIVSDEDLRSDVAELILESNIEIMDNTIFRWELSQYIKSNFTKSRTGMPGFTLGLPDFISIFASRLIKKINLSKKSRKSDEKLLKQGTPAFLIISTQGDKKEDWLNGGNVLQHIWLSAQSYGLSCAPFAAVIQLSVFREKLQNLLHLSDFPQLILRIGYPKKDVKPSPRFLISDLVKN